MNTIYTLPIIKTIDYENSEFCSNDENMQENKKKSRKETYGKGNEAKIIRKELGDFDIFNSQAYKIIIGQFGKSIRLSELLGIINSIQFYLKEKKSIVLPSISRNEKRSFQLLIKYIDNNGDLILPYLQYISLCNSTFQKIPVDTL